MDFFHKQKEKKTPRVQKCYHPQQIMTECNKEYNIKRLTGIKEWQS